MNVEEEKDGMGNLIGKLFHWGGAPVKGLKLDLSGVVLDNVAVTFQIMGEPSLELCCLSFLF